MYSTQTTQDTGERKGGKEGNDERYQSFGILPSTHDTGKPRVIFKRQIKYTVLHSSNVYLNLYRFQRKPDFFSIL